MIPGYYTTSFILQLQSNLQILRISTIRLALLVITLIVMSICNMGCRGLVTLITIDIRFGIIGASRYIMNVFFK